MNKDDKLKALDAALTQIEKAYGKGSVMKLGDSGANMNIETVPTGSLSLDIALGLGGVPKGRVVEIYGPESSGKTTVALHMVAEVQKRGGIAGFIDAEHALDPVYAKNIGVDIDNLYISQPDNGEQALEITETMVRSGAVDIVIVDSVAALVPKAEIDGDMGDSHVGLQARLMSLTDLCALVCIPGTALLNNIRIGSEIKDITLTGDSFSEHNVKLGFFKWRRDLVLYDLYTDMVSDHLSALL